MATRTGKLLEKLRVWCATEHGRKAVVARFVGVSRQAVSNWLSGRQRLTGEQALALSELLNARSYANPPLKLDSKTAAERKADLIKVARQKQK